MVIIECLDLAVLRILNQLQNITAFLNNLLFFFSSHIGAQNLSNNLTVKNLLEFVY